MLCCLLGDWSDTARAFTAGRATAIGELIDASVLHDRAVLPSWRALADALGVALVSVAEAYDLLSAAAAMSMQIVTTATTICMVNDEVTFRQLVARASLRTIRTKDLAAVFANPRQAARALERRGLLHRLAHGFYCAIPAEHNPAQWRPTIEAAAAGIASAVYGDRVPVLTGLTAARVHRALPRAIGVAFTAVPIQRRPLQLLDREGRIHFVTRAVADLDAVLVTTDLGQTLATTPEQTVLDLARADPRGQDADAREAIDALWPECDQSVLAEIAGRQRMRATLVRLRARG